MINCWAGLKWSLHPLRNMLRVMPPSPPPGLINRHVAHTKICTMHETRMHT